MALQEPSVGLFGRITTDNTLPERDSEGADPQRELRNVRPNSLEKAIRSNQASPRARGPALLRTGASATSSCARLVSLDASAMGRHGALGSDRFWSLGALGSDPEKPRPREADDFARTPTDALDSWFFPILSAWPDLCQTFRPKPHTAVKSHPRAAGAGRPSPRAGTAPGSPGIRLWSSGASLGSPDEASPLEARRRDAHPKAER